MISRNIKVTFEDGKTIIEGTPALLFISAEGHGVGQLYKDGKCITHLQKVNIQAQQDYVTTYETKIVVVREV